MQNKTNKINKIDNISTIKILDCTLRDGGLLNKFAFEDNYIKAHIEKLSEAKVDYIEVGYKSSPKYFDKKEYGKLKFCEDEYIYELIQDLKLSSKLAFMIDKGRYDIESIADANKSPFQMARVACYLKDIEAVVEDIKILQNKGYETMINMMAVSRETDEDLKVGLKIIRDNLSSCGVYIVDSYGACLPLEIAKLVKMYKKILGDTPLGIHTHNNMQLAFANTITAMQYGVEFADASVNGMGRSAGNCPIELLMPQVNKDKYKITSVLKLTDMYYGDLRKNLQWGYTDKKMLTGFFNVRPLENSQDEEDLAYSIFTELELEREKEKEEHRNLLN